jgi:hypothetical protein
MFAKPAELQAAFRRYRLIPLLADAEAYARRGWTIFERALKGVPQHGLRVDLGAGAVYAFDAEGKTLVAFKSSGAMSDVRSCFDYDGVPGVDLRRPQNLPTSLEAAFQLFHNAVMGARNVARTGGPSAMFQNGPAELYRKYGHTLTRRPLSAEDYARRAYVHLTEAAERESVIAAQPTTLLVFDQTSREYGRYRPRGAPLIFIGRVADSEWANLRGDAILLTPPELGRRAREARS